MYSDMRCVSIHNLANRTVSEYSLNSELKMLEYLQWSGIIVNVFSNSLTLALRASKHYCKCQISKNLRPDLLMTLISLLTKMTTLKTYPSQTISIHLFVGVHSMFKLVTMSIIRFLNLLLTLRCTLNKSIV